MKTTEAPQGFDPFRDDQDPRGEINPLEMLSTLFRLFQSRWKLILSCGVLLGVLSGSVSFLLKTKFTASCSFIPPSSSGGSSSAALIGQLSSFGGGGVSSLLGGPKSSGDLYVGILKSRSIASDLVQKFKLKEIYHVQKESMAEKTLASHTKFEVGAKDSIVSISVTEPNPVLARDLANAYLDALRVTNWDLAISESSQRRKFFEQRLALEKDALANAEVALKQGQEKSGLIAPIGQTSIELNAIAQLRAQMAGEQVQLASLRQGKRDQNPDIVRVQSEISSLRSQISQMENGKSGTGGAIPTRQVPALELEYIRLARDVKYHETLFDIIAKQYEMARLDEARDPSLQVLDRAIVPDTKSGPPRLIIATIGFLVGLFLGAAWILVQTVRNGGTFIPARS